MQKILEEMKKNKIIERYALLTVLMFVSAINYNLFLFPLNIVAGGTSGLSIVVNEIFNIKPSIFIFIVSAVIVLLSAKVLNKDKIISSLYVTVIYSVFVELTSFVSEFATFNNNELLLVCLMSGIVSGWVGGLVYKIGLSQGGISLIADCLYEKFRFSRSQSNLTINGIIILMGFMIFGATNTMCALVLLYANSIMMNKVLLGISENKVFYIITGEDEKIQKYIIEELKYGATVFDGQGGFRNKKKKVLMTVVPTMQYYKLTTGIRNIDKNAFFVVTDSYQVAGEYKITNGNDSILWYNVIML